MSTRLVLLGLLRQGPLHGYELKHIIETRMGDWTDIAFGSIYFALGKLREEGLVAEVGEEREGRRPAKTVYAVTEAGKAEFGRLLRAVFAGVERQYYEFDTALAFIDDLAADEAESFLRGRIEALAAAERSLRLHEKEQMKNPETPPQAAWIFSHSLAHLRAELAWSKTVLEQLKKKEVR